MIKRYNYPEMEQVWCDQNKYQCWLAVELAVCSALNKKGIIPDGDIEIIEKRATFNVDRILEIEQTAKHDVIAFLSNVAENVGESSRWIHYGMTSSDVLDTATALQCKQAGVLILKSISKLLDILKKRALEYKDIISIGRSHGIHAEPTSFGLKFLLWFDEMTRNEERLTQSIHRISVGKVSGAVGNFAHIHPEIEEITCQILGLQVAKISTQIVQRDVHAEYLQTIALIGTTLEKIALEIRHLQRTEVREVDEGFSIGQKGSSAMPHKKNPITCEQICGLSRLLRSNCSASIENNALWHERDISHSSVERIILPDSTSLLYYMLNKMCDVITNLKVYPNNIKKNLDLTNGLIFSQILLLKLAEKGCTRDEAYVLVQEQAMKCWESNVSFRSLIEADTKIMSYLSSIDIDDIFSLERYRKNIDYIYKRVLND